MKPAEEALQNVWQAMLVRRIWRSFPPLQATAVLITFDEDGCSTTVHTVHKATFGSSFL